MTRRERITRAVYDAVDDLNEQLPRPLRLVKSPETTLLGPGATLDSLGIVNLIAATQERIEEAFGARLTLADGEFLATATQRVATLGWFIDHIEATLDAREHA
jgi:acyl carrier protein